METRANYIVIGLFVVIFSLVALSSLLWFLSAGNSDRLRHVSVIFPGAVSGLAEGSPVLFNGIKIGEVEALSLDPLDPEIVVATLLVDALAPLRQNVEVELGFQGLTGIAHVEMSGGRNRSEPLFPEDESAVPVIYADRSTLQELLDSSQDILARAGRVLKALEEVVSDNQDPVGKTIANIHKFSQELARLPDTYPDFVDNVGALANTLGDLSQGLNGVIGKVDALLGAVEPARIGNIVQNTETATKNLADISQDAKPLIQTIQQFAESLNLFADQLQLTIQQLEPTIAAIDEQKIAQIIDGFSTFASILDKNETAIGALVNQAGTGVDNFARFSENLTRYDKELSLLLNDGGKAGRDLAASMDALNRIMSAIDSEDLSKILAAGEQFTGVLASRSDTTGQMLDDAAQAANDARALLGGFREIEPDVDRFVASANSMVENLDLASEKLLTIMTDLEGGEGVMAGQTLKELRLTIKNVGDLALQLQSSLSPLLDQISNLADRGGSDFGASMIRFRAVLEEIENAARRLSDDPSRLIYGGNSRPTYEPR